MVACLTPQEEQRVREYDQATADQIRRDREYAERPLTTGRRHLIALLEALEREALEDIKFCNSEIGLFLKCKETVKNPELSANIDISLWMLRYKIEENYDDITRWRSYKEAC